MTKQTIILDGVTGAVVPPPIKLDPPIRFDETALVHVPQPTPLRYATPLYPIKRYEQLLEFCIDGRGVIYGAITVWFGLAAWAGYLFIESVAAAVAMVIAALPYIGGIVALILLVRILTRSPKAPEALVLKGCNNGPTPGSHTVKLCNGRH
jgi:hypothetical protein